jgi:lipoic acid synthetase
MESGNGHIPKPKWLKAKIPSGGRFFKIKKDLESRNLHTICQSAKCPNIGECWNEGHATFLVMGNTCTRNCLFCSVKSGAPLPLDESEPRRILEMLEIMNLKYIVITSVTRDDLPDGGSGHFADIIRTIKGEKPDIKIEVLIPDFKGDTTCVQAVLDAGPDVLNHNLETVKRLYEKVNRTPENYWRSLQVLKYSGDKGFLTKSGIMVGLGESLDELKELFSDLVKQGTKLLTIGQYCRPTSANVEVVKYYSPDEFEELKHLAMSFGFNQVESGPFVRSSYHADSMYNHGVTGPKGCGTVKGDG